MQAPSSPDAAWPIILPFIGAPKSAVDFGCGTGHWLAGLRRHIRDIDVFGINSPVRQDAGVSLPKERFQHADLTKPINLGRKFDLAICIEVAEHLPASAASTLVETIARHSDVVLFSAAIPGQAGEGHNLAGLEGDDHLNEQWPAYWIRRFASHSFRCVDCLRPIVWDNAEISLWYRQNIMFFFHPPATPLKAGPDWGGASVVHPQFFELALQPKPVSVRQLWQQTAKHILGSRLSASARHFLRRASM
jgi:SAM-dependent methyltransferase